MGMHAAALVALVTMAACGAPASPALSSRTDSADDGVSTSTPTLTADSPASDLAPSPSATTPAPADCDPNYGGACVPRSSDVDCADGDGDGPAYFDGVAEVIGDDVYGLDRDRDDLACEPTDES